MASQSPFLGLSASSIPFEHSSRISSGIILVESDLIIPKRLGPASSPLLLSKLTPRQMPKAIVAATKATPSGAQLSGVRSDGI